MGRVLDDQLSVLGYLAIVVITGGLVSFVRPGTSWDSNRWALLVAVLIGCYTLADAVGARRTEGIAYVLGTFVATAVTVSAWGLATGHLTNLRRSLATSWRTHLTSGLASAAAYGLVLFAVRGPQSATSPHSVSRRSSSPPSPVALLAEGFGRARLASATVVSPASSCSSSRGESVHQTAAP